MRVSRLENDLDSGESWRKQSDGTLVTLSVQESSAEAESDVRRRIFSMQVKLWCLRWSSWRWWSLLSRGGFWRWCLAVPCWCCRRCRGWCHEVKLSSSWRSCAIVFAHFSGTLTTNKTGVCRFCFEISGIMGHSFASVLPLYIKLKVSFPWILLYLFCLLLLLVFWG